MANRLITRQVDSKTVDIDHEDAQQDDLSIRSKRVSLISGSGSSYSINNPLDVVNSEWVSAYGVDILDLVYYYFGFSLVGTTKWRIKRVKISDLTISWAQGIDSGSTAWTNRSTQTYGEL